MGMKENECRNYIVNRAKEYEGATKGSAKHLDIVNTYNAIEPLPQGYKLKTNDSYCAAFVSAIAAMCDMLDIIPAECSCIRMVELLKKKGIWHENENYVPKFGDLVLYDWQDDGKGDNKGVPDHIGIVAKVEGNAITVIEGNMSGGKVGYRTIAVNGKFLRGFGVPDYASKADEKKNKSVKAPVTPAAKPALKASTIKAEIAVDGSWGEITTRKAQQVFGTTVDGVVSEQNIAYKSSNRGLSSGWEWKNKPKKGGSELIRAIQKWLGVEQDGIFGPKTIRALQKKMGTVQDGYLSTVSDCVKAFQRWLNKQ